MQRIKEERLIKYSVAISKCARTPSTKLITVKLSHPSYSALFSKTNVLHVEIQLQWKLRERTHLFPAVFPNIQVSISVGFCLFVFPRTSNRENSSFQYFKKLISLSHPGQRILGRTKCSPAAIPNSIYVQWATTRFIN